MYNSSFKKKVITTFIILTLTAFITYLFYDAKKLENEVNNLADIHYSINKNFNICNTTFEDIIDVWDDNYYQSQYEINSKIEEYLEINSISSKINDERKMNLQYINKTLEEISDIKFKNKSVYRRKLQEMNSLSKQYCNSVLNYNLYNRDSYPEKVLTLEYEYFDVYSDVSEIIDYYGYK
jgi:hypothetical protein